MTDIVVHGVPGSPFVRAVQVGLEEKHVTYRMQAMGPRESKSEAYLRKHPFGRVPLFEQGDFILYETQAILALYRCRISGAAASAKGPSVGGAHEPDHRHQ